MKTEKIYILAGHSDSDPGAPAAKYGMYEAQLTRNLRNMVFLALKRHPKRQDVTALIDSDVDSLREVLKKIPSTENDIIIDIHFNAATPAAKGVECFVQENRGMQELIKARSIASALCESIAEIMPTKNRGVKDPAQSNRGKLGLMSLKGAVVLLEVCFISNGDELDAYIKNEDAIAEAIVETLIAHI